MLGNRPVSDDEDFYNVPPSNSEADPFTIPVSAPFKLGQRLNPEQVYFSNVGMLQAYSFELCGIVKNDDKASSPIVPELARIYKIPDNEKYYILYYPGKDNRKPFAPGSLVLSLDNILKRVNTAVIKHFGEPFLKNAKQSLTVCENNTYLSFPISHYIQVSKDKGQLTIDDSINRNYDESYIINCIPHEGQVRSIKRGWQNMLLDNWSCGHYAIEALRRNITEEKDPEDLRITDEIIKDHYDWYTQGKQSSHEDCLILTSQDPHDALLTCIKNINYYLSERAQKTSVLLSFFGYDGLNYQLRRQSWENILTYLSNNQDANSIRSFIQDEARQFKNSLFGNHHYYDHLMTLAASLKEKSMPEPGSGAHKRIGAYLELYNEMDNYNSQAQRYVDHWSLFRPQANKELTKKVSCEKEKYAACYAKLDDNDKLDFLDPDKAHLATYRNTLG
jgi:hypothetical protein